MTVAQPTSSLTRGQLFRLRMRAWDRRTLFAAVFVLGIAELRGAASAMKYHSWVPAVLAPAVLVGFVLISALISLVKDDGADRLETVSPEAVRSIRDGLAGAGLPVPDRILLAPRGTTAVRVDGFPRRGSRLFVSLPQILALPSSDLPVLAASAMAVVRATPHRVAAQRLWRKRVVLEARRDLLEASGRLASRQGRRITGFLAATETFARDVRAQADQAATIAAGSADAAARALYGEQTVNLDFFLYTRRFRRLIARKKKVPASLYAGWLAEWAAEPEWLQSPTRYPLDDFRNEHAGLGSFDGDGLAAYITRLRDGREGLPAPSMVSPATAKRMAITVAKRLVPSVNGIRAVDGDRIDVAFLYSGNDEPDRDILAAASAVLGRPADRVAAAELLREHAYDLAAAALGPDSADAEDPDGGLNRGIVLSMLLVGALKARAMLQLDPYHEWIFTGPDGDRIDVAEVVTGALPPRGDTDRLYALLRG